jgi:hypothetical protein
MVVRKKHTSVLHPIWTAVFGSIMERSVAEPGLQQVVDGNESAMYEGFLITAQSYNLNGAGNRFHGD